MLYGMISTKKNEAGSAKYVQATLVFEDRHPRLEHPALKSMNSKKPLEIREEFLSNPTKASAGDFFPRQRPVAPTTSEKPLNYSKANMNSAQPNNCTPDPDLFGIKVSMSPSLVREHLGVSPINQMLELIDGRPLLLHEYLLKTGKRFTFVFSDNELEMYATGTSISILYSLRDKTLQKLYSTGNISLVELESRRLQTYRALYGNGSQSDFLKVIHRKYELALALQMGKIDGVTYQSYLSRLNVAPYPIGNSCEI